AFFVKHDTYASPSPLAQAVAIFSNSSLISLISFLFSIITTLAFFIIGNPTPVIVSFILYRISSYSTQGITSSQLLPQPTVSSYRSIVLKLKRKQLHLLLKSKLLL